MNILLIHPNYPAQFVHLSKYLAELGHNVVYLSKRTNNRDYSNIRVAVYKTKPQYKDEKHLFHPYARYFEKHIYEGDAVASALLKLKSQIDFVPDVILGHVGWGSTLYIKDIYPDVPLIGYFEWYYHAYGSDVGYYEDEPVNEYNRKRIRSLDASQLLCLTSHDHCLTPTEWQKSQYPSEFYYKFSVIHEGIDTNFYKPNKNEKLIIPTKGLDLSKVPEIVLYSARGLERYRGFPQFMDAIRIVLEKRPNCHVVIVGEDKSCYGRKPDKNKTWKQVEVEKGGYDESRVHFTDRLDFDNYLRVLQSATVRVYLTRPFVPSWSMFESMSCGTAMVGSDTPPVQEIIKDGVNGLIAKYRDPKDIADKIIKLLDDKKLRTKLGNNARKTIVEKYNKDICTKEQVKMIEDVVKNFKFEHFKMVPVK